ncbi:MAG TPA: NADH-quinone oxidoreductase subunit A [Nitrospira sp.]|nr:NADH-quinone oxidoreductase subunit A [Nitrospira sp.]
MTEPLWPLVAYFIAALVVAAIMIGASALLGERHSERTTGEPYESGIAVTGSAQNRLPVQFYLVAMLFVIFDLEAVYLFAWAVAVPEVGWLGFGEMLVFITVLFIALAYVWRVGALDWGTSPRRILVRRRKDHDAVVAQQADGRSPVS